MSGVSSQAKDGRFCHSLCARRLACASVLAKASVHIHDLRAAVPDRLGIDHARRAPHFSLSPLPFD